MHAIGGNVMATHVLQFILSQKFKNEKIRYGFFRRIRL